MNGDLEGAAPCHCPQARHSAKLDSSCDWKRLISSRSEMSSRSNGMTGRNLILVWNCFAAPARAPRAAANQTCLDICRGRMSPIPTTVSSSPASTLSAATLCSRIGATVTTPASTVFNICGVCPRRYDRHECSDENSNDCALLPDVRHRDGHGRSRE